MHGSKNCWKKLSNLNESLHVRHPLANLMHHLTHSVYIFKGKTAHAQTHSSKISKNCKSVAFARFEQLAKRCPSVYIPRSVSAVSLVIVKPRNSARMRDRMHSRNMHSASPTIVFFVCCCTYVGRTQFQFWDLQHWESSDQHRHCLQHCYLQQQWTVFSKSSLLITLESLLEDCNPLLQSAIVSLVMASLWR